MTGSAVHRTCTAMARAAGSTNRNLYIAVVPERVTSEQLDALFRSDAGFVAVKLVRRMCFVEFRDERCAAAAMRKHQGFQFPGTDEPLVLDFDKDSSERRSRTLERQQRELALQDQLLATDGLACTLCNTEAINVEPGHDISIFPRRATDGAIAVNEKASLRRLVVCRAPVRLLRRDDGGVERHYPILCPSCNVQLGYRSAPLGSPSDFLYLYPGAVDVSRKASGATEGDTIVVGSSSSTADRDEEPSAKREKRGEA
jgi:hypothetical protein